VAYDRCCGPFHRGEQVAPTAEALMRSRYSAFALGLTDHLWATWHPRTRPATIELDPALEWVRLDVLGTTGGGADDTEGEVEFTAHHRAHGRRGELHERSRFVRRVGRWFYVEGVVG
jgi:SEC-C motif-containing protein